MQFYSYLYIDVWSQSHWISDDNNLQSHLVFCFCAIYCEHPLVPLLGWLIVWTLKDLNHQSKKIHYSTCMPHKKMSFRPIKKNKKKVSLNSKNETQSVGAWPTALWPRQLFLWKVALTKSNTCGILIFFIFFFPIVRYFIWILLKNIFGH